MSQDSNEAVVQTTKSADDIIIQDELQRLGKIAPEPLKEIEEPIEAAAKKQPVNDDETESLPLAADDDSSKQKEGDDEQEAIDEYGNQKESKKLYTEEEVQNLIRDRLKRTKHAQETNNTENIQPSTQSVAPNQEGSEDWQQELEKFIDNTLNKRTIQEQQKRMREQEDIRQAEFEIKFTQGMSKYKDFREVVEGKPVTPELMMAVRSMDNPAAFIYAACKQYPGEIDRINKIDDPYHKIAEVGRLEERMKKAKSIPQSPKPSKKIVGDASDDLPKADIDSLIITHAKSKIRR